MVRILPPLLLLRQHPPLRDGHDRRLIIEPLPIVLQEVDQEHAERLALERLLDERRGAPQRVQLQEADREADDPVAAQPAARRGVEPVPREEALQAEHEEAERGHAREVVAQDRHGLHAVA